jgi:hypothetical protein
MKSPEFLKKILLQVVKDASDYGEGETTSKTADVCSRYVHEETFFKCTRCRIDLASYI